MAGPPPAITVGVPSGAILVTPAQAVYEFPFGSKVNPWGVQLVERNVEMIPCESTLRILKP